MRKLTSILVLIFAATACFAGVTISSPASGATVGSPVHFVASASGATTIASMIVYVDGNQSYLVYSSNVDTNISLGAGSHTAVIKAWDNWGGVYSQTVTFTVGTAPAPPTGAAGVKIISPTPGATVTSPVNVVATATPSGSAPIASMILYVDGNQQYLTYSASMNTNVSPGAGTHQIVINSWDNLGQIYTASETIIVGSASTPPPPPSGAWVNLTSPTGGASAGSPVTVTANGGSANGISGWVVYVDDANAYQVNNNSNSLSASVNIGSGSHTLYVRGWDRSDGTYGTSSKITISVGGSGGGGSTPLPGTPIYTIEQMGGWGSCSDCAGAGGAGPIAGYSMTPGQGSPSLDGSSTQFSIWGDTPYSDVLWWKSLSSIIGDTSKPHHFVYDAYFYLNDSAAVQALEFDINQFVNGHSLIFGTQCNVLAGHLWDVWDNQNNRWVHTSKYCPIPAANTWHHVTVEVERASDGGDWLHYISITFDGEKTYLDAWYPPASTGWNGVTVNFQMDGNYRMAPYSVWLDKLTLSYW